jgi:photosystem II stability/assembly factor-like uncharacterized protein
VVLMIQMHFARPYINMLMARDCLPPQGHSYEYAISDTIRLRYGNHHRDVYRQDEQRNVMIFSNRYFITQDGGQTWREFLISMGEGCGFELQHGKLNDRFFWLWQGKEAVFTRDGGKTWALWRGENALSNHQDCMIQRITFSGAWVGYMDCHFTGSTNPVLRTNDGGFTWYQTGG